MVIHEPNELLHQKSDPVEDFAEVKRIAGDLLITVKRWGKARWWNPFLGIAAPQIGFMRRIIVMQRWWNHYTIMINPVIVKSRIPVPYIERCYSVDGMYLVKRYLWARVRYQDVSGVRHETVIIGPSAIYQEIDHLNGILVSQIGVRVL